MKNTRMIFTALAVALTLGTFQVEAKKSAARERFDASYDRLKRCFKGKCTKMEVLKAGRDVAAAAIAVAATVYLASKASEAGLARAGKKAKEEYGKGRASSKLGYASYQAGRPAAAMERGAAATAARARGLGARVSTARTAAQQRWTTFRAPRATPAE